MFQVELLISLLLNSGTKGAQPPSQSVILSYSPFADFFPKKISFVVSQNNLTSYHVSSFSVAPVCYAHLAAQQMGQFIKFDDLSETSSAKRAITTEESVPVPELPRLHENVRGSMFFCWVVDKVDNFQCP